MGTGEAARDAILDAAGAAPSGRALSAFDRVDTAEKIKALFEQAGLQMTHIGERPKRHTWTRAALWENLSSYGWPWTISTRSNSRPAMPRLRPDGTWSTLCPSRI